MRIFRARALISVVAVPALVLALGAVPASAQSAAVVTAETALDAAMNMANILDGAGAGISGDAQILALEAAANAGQPMALYQLGLMYENGEGVEKDPVKAFGYFSQIANEHADAAPRGLEADIVAQSFVKVGEYYATGLPEAGIAKDEARSNRLMMHAASYFGDADAQYRVGLTYLEDENADANSLQSARWLSLAARKGHAPAQAKLGYLLFSGDGIEANPVEGLMWLTMASRRAVGTPDQVWIQQMLSDAMSLATPEQQAQATELANSLGERFGGLS